MHACFPSGFQSRLNSADVWLGGMMIGDPWQRLADDWTVATLAIWLSLNGCIVIVGKLASARGNRGSLVLLGLFNYVTELTSAEYVVVIVNHRGRDELDLDIFLAVMSLTFLPDSKLVVL